MAKSYKLKSCPIDANPDGDLLERLLAVRGIGDAERDIFLKPDFETGLHDPFLLKDMDRTVERIIKAIHNKEHILIYSDYDADGLPGASIFHDFFKTISYPHVSFFQPDRHVDGFGVHAHLLDEYLGKVAEGVEVVDATGKKLAPATLMITIDCGISDVEPVRVLSENGLLDVIVTDHHLPGPVLPAAYAIVNPKRADCEYPEKMLCGSGVAYKIVCALVSKMDNAFPAGYTKWLLDLVGIATMSDMVPLRGENRLLAYYGLMVLRKTKRPGIISLCRSNMLEPRNIVEDDIAFTIAPRINVASRLAHPKMAFDLLTSGSFDEASRIAKDLNNINNRRKTMVAQIMKQAHAKVREMQSSKPILVIGNPDWKPPVLGLVATQLIKAYGKPTFVWGRDDSGSYKGSARSTANIDIVQLMYAVPDEVFINKGGHAQSGGFCVHPDHIFGFDEAMQKACEKVYGVVTKLSPNVTVPSTTVETGMCHEVDAIIDVKDINAKMFSIIEKLAPYGVGNEKPLFAIKNFHIKNARLFGKTGEHLELEHSDWDSGQVKAIQFFYTEGTTKKVGEVTSLDELKEDPLFALKQNTHKAIIGHIEKNQFRGASDIRVRIVDVV
jgi:single-stranded-DNA-specific exonuclease